MTTPSQLLICCRRADSPTSCCRLRCSYSANRPNSDSRSGCATLVSLDSPCIVPLKSLRAASGCLHSFTLLAHGTEQLVAGKRFGQIMVRSNDSAPGLVKQAVLAGQHDDRHILEARVVLDDGACLIAIQSGHHDIDEYQVGIMLVYQCKGGKAVVGRNDFSTFLAEHGFSRSANGSAVIDKHDFDAVKIHDALFRVGVVLVCAHVPGSYLQMLV